MWFRRKEGTYGIPAFMKGRVAQSDDEFFRLCELPNDPTARRIAIDTRKIIAKLGEVEPQWIRHDDRFDVELCNLRFWKGFEYDSLSSVEFVMAVEDTLKMTIPDDDYEHVHIHGTNVKSLVCDMVRVLKPKLKKDN